MKSNFLETIKILDGEIFNIDYHQKRYENVLSSFGVKDIQDLKEFIKPPKDGIYRCRLVYSIVNSNIEVSYHKYKKREISSLKLVYDNDIDYSKKYSERNDIDRLYKLRDKCDEILIVKNNLVADTSIANIAFYDNGVWLTPKQPLLKGTTRQRYLDNGKIIEADIFIEDINKYSKVALLNAMIDFDIISNISFKN